MTLVTLKFSCSNVSTHNIYDLLYKSKLFDDLFGINKDNKSNIKTQIPTVISDDPINIPFIKDEFYSYWYNKNDNNMLSYEIERYLQIYDPIFTPDKIYDLYKDNIKSITFEVFQIILTQSPKSNKFLIQHEMFFAKLILDNCPNLSTLPELTFRKMACPVLIYLCDNTIGTRIEECYKWFLKFKYIKFYASMDIYIKDDLLVKYIEKINYPKLAILLLLVSDKISRLSNLAYINAIYPDLGLQ